MYLIAKGSALKTNGDENRADINDRFHGYEHINTNMMSCKYIREGPESGVFTHALGSSKLERGE